jgi:hypothetical protein
MTITDLSPGHAVQPMEGETEIWPTLAVASIGTIVGDAQGHEWTRHRRWWAGSDGARLTSAQLGIRGPLTVHSVHVCEDWIDSSSMCSATVTSMCVSCGLTKEAPR